MADYPHHHFQVPANRRELRFKGSGRGKFNRRTDLSREEHAARLQQQLTDVQGQFEAEQLLRDDSEFADDFALLLNIKSAPGYPLKLDSFESKPSKNNEGIYLLNVRTIETEAGLVMCAAISVPVGRLDVLVNKVEAFADPSKDLKSPRNADLLANIDSITVAALEALWMEPEPLPEADELVWWELWVSRADRGGRSEQSWLDRFEVVRDTLGLEANRFRLSLPDNVVVMVQATRAQLESSLDLLNTLTEVHKVRPCSIDLPHLDNAEQNDWMQLALERVDWPEDSAPAVCILDTGVNRAHPLLEHVLSEADADTMIPEFGAADHLDPRDAHGTPMAGLVAYDDLRGLMVSTTGRWVQSHRLESMKLIHSGDEHEAENYGAITNGAIARQESKRPDRSRVYCMALTQLGVDVKGQPSAWSAGVDASAAGTNEEYAPKRVIFLSAGNHRNFLDYEYMKSNAASLIESPAQAWNGITVGAMTRRVGILEGDDESLRSRAIAPAEGVSPFTRTSADWDPRWPIKPDIVMEGGNLAITESGEPVEKDSLLLVSTASNFLVKPLCNMNATSAATASASRLGAMVQAKFPGYWAETYRGLMVHSARWSRAALNGVDPHRAGNSAAIQQILRHYGYGEPYQPRLFGSGESGITMIIQDQIQPYDPDSNAGEAKLGYFNLHDLTWPKDAFAAYPDVELTLKATLSYFIDPNPGSRCWDRSKKYRYASHLLRFRFKRATEDDAVFQGLLEKEVESEENALSDVQQELDLTEKPAASDARWALGPQLRGKAGSLVQDIWKGTPADLAAMDQVAIFPVKGWFATRSFPEGHEFHNCHQRTVRYSLILSIDAEEDVGLYADIASQASVDV